MRETFCSLYDLALTPRLHGISVVGRQLAFCCLHKPTGLLTPGYIAPSAVRVTNTVPKARWDVDVTTEEGYQRFTEVVEDIKQMALAF